MKALCWHGKHDVRHDTVPDPTIEAARDAIAKVMSCAMCGSGLHLFDGFIPTMKHGDIMGREFMGEVVEVGPQDTKIEVGDRGVVPFTICCGECEHCRHGNVAVCERSDETRQWPTGCSVRRRRDSSATRISLAVAPVAGRNTCACRSPMWRQ